MAIKTDAMIAHNGADGYTIHVEYDTETEDFAATAVFNDGTEKDLSGGGVAELDDLIDRSIASVQSDATSVGTSAFNGCQALADADFPEATVLGAQSFYQCLRLRNLNTPKVKQIGENAFYHCTTLKNVILPEATSIANSAFSGCTGLKYVYLGEHVILSGNAFNRVTQADLVIDCAFAANSTAASNAPWGATSATINYGVEEPNPPADI